MTTAQVGACLQVLKEATEPIVAADLAERLGLAGKRETKRRKVRAMVEHLRDNGARIIATLNSGYWLTGDSEIWCDYLAKRTIDSKRILGEAYRRRRDAAMGESGQGYLFAI